MARRARQEDIEEQETQSPIDELWEQEIDRDQLDELEAQVRAEEKELEESRKAPEGDYITVTPYPVTRRVDEIVAIDSEGDEAKTVRRRYSFWGDAIHEELGSRFKLGIDVSPDSFYVVFNGMGKQPTYYTTKVKGARLDSAARNMNAAVKLYEEATGRTPKRFSEIESFLTETQLRLKVKKFSSGKSGVVAFELAK